jgi:acylglycerol lipase
MIAVGIMVATVSQGGAVPALPRRGVLAGGAAAALALAACAGVPPAPAPQAAGAEDGRFIMLDGAALPYRRWLPQGAPATLILALHGMNDSRDAWEVPAAAFTDAGCAIYAPDQRGFGSAPGRGRWPGTATLVADAAASARQMCALHPGVPLVLMGESMGGAVLMCLAAGALAPAGARYVLVAPAVWGRAEMNLFLRASLWLGASLLPGVALSGAPVHVMASDNMAALIRLSRDPLTIHDTRLDTLRGLVDLMDAALAAAPHFRAPGLFMYGGKDELVPKRAMAAMWRHLPADGRTVLAYYPDDYHLMLRDLGRAKPIGDVLSWLRDPASPLPSGATAAAARWLSGGA